MQKYSVMDLMLKKFLSFVSENRLFNPETDRVLLAVSGGSDSVVMTDIFYKARVNFAISHVNFHLRGNDSDEDENFVRQLAKKYGAEIFVKNADTLKYAAEKKLSVEMAAREIRYAEFFSIMKEKNFQFTAVAHHQDDAVETFFLNLLRGSGIRGLTGIKIKNDRIIRPLMCFSRAEILDYADKNNLSFRTDKTNFENAFSRNKIRNMIIPLFGEINPSFRQNAVLSMKFLSQAKNIYENAIESEKRRIFHGETVKIADILQFSEPECLLYEIVEKFGFNRSQSQEIFRTFFSGESGKQFFSATHKILRDRETLIVSQLKDQDKTEDEISEDGILTGEKEFSNLKLKFEIIAPDCFSPQRDAKTAYFDYEKLTFPLKLTFWQKGDSFVPFGGRFRKKLSDFFTDNKLTVNEKQNVRLLKSGGEIIWIAGFRASDLCKVTKDTKKILKISTV